MSEQAFGWLVLTLHTAVGWWWVIPAEPCSTCRYMSKTNAVVVLKLLRFRVACYAAIINIIEFGIRRGELSQQKRKVALGQKAGYKLDCPWGVC